MSTVPPAANPHSFTVDDIRKAEEKVLFPELDDKTVQLAGTKVSLRPLPIFFSKQINQRLAKLQEQFSAAMKRAKEDRPSQLGDTFDVDVAEGLIDATMVLLSFYKAAITRDDLDKGSTTDELIRFCEAQVKLNGDNDFLLQPLRTIIAVAALSHQAMSKLRTLLSSPLLSKPGGSDLKSSLEPTPTAS